MLWGLSDRFVDEVIAVYRTRDEAVGAMKAMLADEPKWEGMIEVVPVAERRRCLPRCRRVGAGPGASGSSFARSGKRAIIRGRRTRPLRALRLIVVVLCAARLSGGGAGGARGSRSSTTRGTETPRSTAAGRTGSHREAHGRHRVELLPARGLYSSSSARIVRAQMREIAAAGVQEVVCSWWGWGSSEDARLPLVIQEAHAAGLSVAVHLEPYPDRTIDRPGRHPPPASRWGSRASTCTGRSTSPRPTGSRSAIGDRRIQLFAQTSLPGKAAKAGFDGIYTYDILLFGGDMFPRSAPRPTASASSACRRSGRATTPRARPPTSARSRAATARPTTRCGRRPSTRAPTA